MSINITYFATVFNSTIRLMAPILFVALTACLCSKVGVFNIGLEGTMLTGAFMAIMTLYYTKNVYLAIIVAAISGAIVSFIVSVLIVKFGATPLVVGISVNTLMSGTTTFLMTVVFGSKGVFYDSSLKGLPKLALPIIRDIPVISTMFKELTILDYMAFIAAVLVYIFMYKTVTGYRLRAIGINKEAAKSLGSDVDRFQIATVTLSGILAGIGGSMLTVASTVIYTQNISSGKGYIALAANNLAVSHPLGAMASSLLFGFSDAIGNMLQNTSIKSSILDAIPYAVTILALVFIYIRDKQKNSKKAETEENTNE